MLKIEVEKAAGSEYGTAIVDSYGLDEVPTSRASVLQKNRRCGAGNISAWPPVEKLCDRYIPYY